MARRPEREMGLPVGLDGVGVVERGVRSWMERLDDPLDGPLDLLLPIFQDMVNDERQTA